MRTRAKEKAHVALHTFDDWLHAHKSLGALGAAFVFGFFGLVGFGVALSPHDLVMAREWQDQRWRQLTCTVEDVGIAYRGNCGPDAELTTTGYSQFKECRGPSETIANRDKKRKAWDAMPAGRCAELGDQDFWRDTDHYDKPKKNPAELEMEEEEELGTERRLLAPALPPAVGRQLFRPKMRIRSQNVDSGPPVLCRNGYLLWATVQVLLTSAPTSAGTPLPNASSPTPPTSRGCAFEYGASAPSVTADWAAVTGMMSWLQSAHRRRVSLDCWVLADNPCVIAFHSRQMLVDAKRSRYRNMERGASCCGVLSCLFVMLAVFWRSEAFLGTCLGHDQRSTFSALPTHDPSELEDGSPKVGRLASSSHPALSFLSDSANLSGEAPRSRTASWQPYGSEAASAFGPTPSGETRTEAPAKGKGRRVSALDIALAEMTASSGLGELPEFEQSEPLRAHLSTHPGKRPGGALRASTK